MDKKKLLLIRRKILLQSILKYINDKRMQNRRRKRRYWIRPTNTRRNEQGAATNLVLEMALYDMEWYHNYMRMSPNTFYELLELITPLITKTSTNFRKPLPPHLRLSLTLRYLSSGDLLSSMAMLYRIGRSTATCIIHETCEAIWTVLSPKELFQPSEKGWLEIANEFENRWNFPHCIGAIDGKHVVIQAPEHSGSTYYNYKGQYSVVLMAVASASYRFLMVDIGAQGRHSDGGTFRNSVMGQRFANKEMDLPTASPLHPNIPQPVPYMLVADAAFQLNEYTLRPYPGKRLTDTKEIFNYRLSRARGVVENSFGIMAARWRIFRRQMNTSLETTISIIKASVCLHNFLIPKSEYNPSGYGDYVNSEGNIVPGHWRQHDVANINSIRMAGANAHSQYASNIRDTFALYFQNEGALNWQHNYIAQLEHN